MGLTLVTHTRGNRPQQLARCIESVGTHLPVGCNHVVIETNDLMKARWDARLLDEYIAFVDDDDVVVNDSISKCWYTLRQGYDLAFTYEARTSPTGEVLAAKAGGVYMYSNIAHSPKIAHHLAAFSTSKLTESWGLYERFGGGLEWFMKAEAGLKGTACHIQQVGYHWTSHVDCYSGNAKWKVPYDKHMNEMRAELSKWIIQDSFIPVFDQNKWALSQRLS